MTKKLKKKKTLGQFFTKNNFWLKKHLIDFIHSTQADIAFDPFAGEGDLLRVLKELGIPKSIGFDIDRKLNWQYNDSLISIPTIKNSVIITNPPYLTNYSAKRKKIYGQVKKYFENCHHDDLYKLSIEKCFSNQYGIMIVPETFINSNFPKNRLVSITIIEDNLFNDTETPVCIICFDGREKDYSEIKVFKNDTELKSLAYYEQLRKKPTRNIQISFNEPKGNIALRAVDTTNPYKPIQFMKPEEIDYDLSTIKHSSRLITLINFKIEKKLLTPIINNSNQILEEFRFKTKDILLSPFKGNKNNGERRRRLDYTSARSILEEAYQSLQAKLL